MRAARSRRLSGDGVITNAKVRGAGALLRKAETPSAVPSGWHENIGGNFFRRLLHTGSCVIFVSLWHPTWPIRLRMVSHAGVFPGSSATFCESFHGVFSCFLLLHRIQSIRPTRQSHPTPLRKLKILRLCTRSWLCRRTRRRRWSNAASGCTRQVAPFATEPAQPAARADQISCAP